MKAVSEEMFDFIKNIDSTVIEAEVKDVMISVGFNRTLVNALEGVGCNTFTVNRFDTVISTKSAETVVNALSENGFSVVMEESKVRIKYEQEKEDGMSKEDVAFYFFDTLDRY